MQTWLGAQGYPPDWDAPVWDGDLAVHLGPAGAGWVWITLSAAARAQSAKLRCSNVYDPFENVLAWLEALARGEFPPVLVIDEEGIVKRLWVRPVAPGDARIEFRVSGDLYQPDARDPQDHAFLLLRTTHRQLVRAWTERLLAWLEDVYDPAEWSMDWYSEEATDELRQKMDMRNLFPARLRAVLRLVGG